MSYTSPSSSVSIEILLQAIQQLSHRMEHIERADKHSLKSAPAQDDAPSGTRTRFIRTTQATTIRPGTDLVQHYPAILERNFYTAELADNHQFYNLSDYHYTEGMIYKAPPVIDHAEVSLSPAAKKHDADLAAIQTRMAQHTRSTTPSPATFWKTDGSIQNNEKQYFTTPSRL
ncbi:hypothetical protein BGX24_010847 [Mortierella sp. AD032]|nr:hypothetical protein BGX24_010847 [Mortierella sp. AD032]